VPNANAATIQWTALRISETTTIDSATAAQTSHCPTVSGVVRSSTSSGSSVVARMTLAREIPVATANGLSANVSRVNTVLGSSLVVTEKNRLNGEKVTSPIVCATISPRAAACR
jgi:hypothetical protein